MRRLPSGGAIDRTRPFEFRWNDDVLQGYAGDTLASALLGAGLITLGESGTFQRPRGITSAGIEESSAFVQLGPAASAESLVRATAIPLTPGLEARGLVSKGTLTAVAPSGRHDKRYAHCDILIIGAGPAGLAAALHLADVAPEPPRVILADLDFVLGGAIWRDADSINGVDALVWVKEAVSRIRRAPDTRILQNTTAVQLLDHGGCVLVERRGGRGQRLWHVRARTIVLATGARERAIVFQDNDRPGIMLAGAARLYQRRFAIVPTRAVVFTGHDDGYRTAVDWHTRGIEVTVVDPRAPAAGSGSWIDRAEQLGIRSLTRSVVTRSLSHADDGSLRGVVVRSPDRTEELAADMCAVLGGFEPNTDLLAGVAEDVLAYDAARFGRVWVAGSAAGRATIGDCIEHGVQVTLSMLQHLGLTPPYTRRAAVAVPVLESPPAQLWQVAAPDGVESRSFVDLARDVTVAGLRRAVDSGVRHIEHVKRYTLAGTGADQGRGGRANVAAVTAAMVGAGADAVPSRNRPPTEPVLFATLAGRATGPRFDPVRTTPLHALHRALGVVFEPVGSWLRPRYYPRPGESLVDAASREARAVRQGAGIADLSTLGKIDVRGPDAATFLGRLYATAVEDLAPGRARYAVLCRLDGSVLDDGVVMRLAPDHFLLTTSTSHAATVYDWLEEWKETEWPSLHVWLTPVTEQWATIALAGPASRALLAQLTADIDVAKDHFPFMAVRTGTVAGIAGARVARISYSGELAFEISVPSTMALHLWQAITTLRAHATLTPYGLEAMNVLRIEKGYIVVGQDTEATTLPADAGLGRLVSRSKAFVGSRSLTRPVASDPTRPTLVGFRSEGTDGRDLEGAGLVQTTHAKPPLPIVGHITSACWSPVLNRTVGLALVRGGRSRLGQHFEAPLGARSVIVTLVEPAHVDPQGAYRDG